MSNVSRHMKRLILSVLLAVPLAVVAETSQGAVASWATAVSKQEGTGRAIVFRYAQGFKPEFQRSRFPDRVILVWRYRSESGMPSKQERESMDRMENQLVSLVDGSGNAILALVSTGEDLREWIFYAKSEEDFIAALNEALESEPASPIEIHAAADPQWSTYERFRRGLRE